jgi:hypothetical protein
MKKGDILFMEYTTAHEFTQRSVVLNKAQRESGMVWYVVGWYGVAWGGMVRVGVVWCRVGWYGAAWGGIGWYASDFTLLR